MMRLSVERLRLALIAGAALLVLVLAAWIGLGRYRALRTWRRILQHSGASLIQETDGYTFSQSLQGRTVFTLHAAKAIQHKDGKWTLHDVVLTLYGRVAGRADRMYGSQFEYDQKEGVARAIGEVNMDLQAPSALAAAGRAMPHGLDEGTGVAEKGMGSGSEAIHVRTSGLVYVRKLDVAATDQEVEFTYHGLQGKARGAEFNSGESTLRLLSDVHLWGEVHDRPFDLTAQSADLNRKTNLIALSAPVARSQGRSGAAERAVLYLRKDGSVERAEAEGRVLLRKGTIAMTAARLEAAFSAQTMPQAATFLGGVTMENTDVKRPAHGTALRVELRFDAQGAPVLVTSESVHAVEMDASAAGPPLRRELRGDEVTARLTPVGRGRQSRLTQVRVTGAARVLADSVMSSTSKQHAVIAPLHKNTSLEADELLATFAAGATKTPVLQKVQGSGHATLQQSAPQGAQQTSTGDTLLLTFAPATRAQSKALKNGAADEESAGALQIATAVQTGHVEVRSVAAQKPDASTEVVPLMVNARRAVYTAASNRMEMEGGTRLEQGDLSLTAREIALDTMSGDATAQGALVANLQAHSGDEVTHITAAEAHLTHATRVAEFEGNTAQPAKMWQGASQIEAAKLTLDGASRSLSATGQSTGERVHAVFARMARVSEAGGAKKPQAHDSGPGTDFVRVSSLRMDYSDVRREAVFAGGVQMEGTLGQASSQRAVVILVPVKTSAPVAGEPSTAPERAKVAAPGPPLPVGGALERVVLLGGVEMRQPGRRATGNQLTYTAATGEYVLTGTPAQPPRVVDAEQGSVMGTTLVFAGSGSTIVVAGTQGKGKRPPQRVRSETVVKQPQD